MKSKAACISVLLGFLMFGFLVSGCSESQMTYSGGSEDLFEDAASKRVHVIDVSSYQDGSSLVIAGTVKRAYNFCCDDAKGHVDIVVTDGEGFVVGTASTYHSPRNIPKTRTRSAKFEARLPISLPDGAVIRTAYHEDSEYAEYAPGTRDLQCRLNMATPGIGAL